MRPSRTYRFQLNILLTLLLTLSFLLTSFLPPFQSNAYAWKPRTHLSLADMALVDAMDDGKVTIYRVNYADGSVAFENGEAVIVGEYAIGARNEAALEYGYQFNAGAMGPDAYPDVLTGQQAVHPDNRSSGSISDTWLTHLWEAADAPAYVDKPYVRAFVLGFLAHAAGDMFGHTFINHYSGGTFSLDYNAVKHVVLEGYVDKRTPDPVYPEYRIEGLHDFIYNAMIDARPEVNPLSPPLYGEGTDYSVPALFSDMRRELERDVRDYHNKLADYDRIIGENRDNAEDCGWTYFYRLDGSRYKVYAEPCHGFWNGKAELVNGEKLAFAGGTRGLKARYYESWISDIEDGLRKWPELNHQIARAVTYAPNGTDFSRAQDLMEEYIYSDLISMAGAPDQVGEFAALSDSVVDQIVNAVPDVAATVSQMKRDFYFYLIEQSTGVDAEEEIEQWKEYMTSPEAYFDEVMARGEGAPVTLAELNRDVLLLDDGGYRDPAETYSVWTFPAAYNTMTMIKLLLMEPSEVRRLMRDLGSPVAEQPAVWSSFSNAMLGFMATMDGDNQWCANPNKMVVARDPAAYTQIFMHQQGQRLVGECPNYLDPASFGSLGSGASAAGISANVDTGGSDGLRVRNAPDPQATIIGRLPNGTAITPVARSADGLWLRIVWPAAAGGFAWVRHEWVRLSVPISSLPVWNPASGGQAGGTPATGGTQSSLPAPTGTIALPIFDGTRGTYDVWLVDADGSNLRKVVSEASAPALSPDGQRLAYRRWKRDDRGIVVAGRDGNNPLRVTANLEDVLPSFSPDGKRVIFSSYRESDRRSRIYYVWSDEANYKAWEWSGGSLYGEDPAWAADGGVVFVGVRPVRELRAMQDGGGNQRAIMAPDSAVRSPAVSPDGSRIVYMTSVNGNHEVYVANRDGSGPVRLTQDAAEDGLPVWSPSGQHIAFVSRRSGAWALWVMEASGANARQIVALPGSVDGRVKNEMEYLTKGWLEEQLAWSR